MHICIDDYVVRVISISDEVYEELSMVKDGKSFTQVIKALLKGGAGTAGRRGDVANLERFFGVLNKKDAGAWKKEVAEGRRRSPPREFM